MPKWFPIGLTVAVGGLAAIVSALSMPPLAAFAAGALLALAVAAALVRRTEEARLAAGPAEGGAPMPSGFGRALIEKLPTPLLVVSRTGRVSYANPAAQASLPRLEAGGHFAHLIRAPVFVEAVTATLADGEERRVRFLTHQGQERFFEARVGLLPPGDAFGPEARASCRSRTAPTAARGAAALGLHRQRQPRAPDAARLDHRLHRDAAAPREERSRGARAVPRDHGARGRADAAAGGRPHVAQPHRDERARPPGGGGR